MDAGAARRLQGVELHVEVLAGSGYAGVADCDGHDLYETTPLAPGAIEGVEGSQVTTGWKCLLVVRVVHRTFLTSLSPGVVDYEKEEEPAK